MPSEPEIIRDVHELKDGRTVVFFLNKATNLIVVDVVDKDESGGYEILRRNV